MTPKSETTRPPFPSSQGHREGLVLRGSRSLSFSDGEARDQVFHPLHSARLRSSIFALPIQETRLREARSAEAPRPCAYRTVTRSATAPSAHPNSSDPLCQPGTPRTGISRVPLALRNLDSSLPRPVLPTFLQPCPSSGVLAPRSEPVGSRGQRASSGPAPRRLRNPWLGLWRGVMSVRVGRSLDLDSQALSSPAIPVAAPNPAAGPRRKTMRPPGGLGRAPAAPPASRSGPPPARLEFAATNRALAGWLDPASSTHFHQ